ncbi:glycosyltransferase [Motilibacter aurantiacus]|uniref:glycosyltransferase n=1 Tax=Motilibacter aurantiacus TaxID=2714955 RepID=UPI00140A41B6|nr:glycosyltransferase [Motilibacter aurantiacus]NHC46232.1 glycosyltransferase [Motilibacter aurantiacus]
MSAQRPPVSVVVTAAGPVAELLSSLKPSLRLQDEVLVVAGAPVGPLAGARAVRAPAGASLAELRALGLAAARGEVVLLVDGDCIAPPHAVDQLAAALVDGVAAVGPRTDLAAGRQQLVPPVASVQSRSSLRAFAREQSRQLRGEHWAAEELADLVLAARASDLARVDDLGAGLGARLAAVEDGRLAVAAESWWSHRDAAGTCSLRPAQRPLVSGCMIVKDEEDVLAASISALQGFCDEVVVYDTGSTDRTVEIARAAGARVVPGYWNDHFADARNRALLHCLGQWAFFVDADEVASGSPQGFRRLMRDIPGHVGSCVIRLENEVVGVGAGSQMRSRRIVRTQLGWWAGRLHEQLMGRDGDVPLEEDISEVRLVHSGYLPNRMTERDKYKRNADLARLAVEDGALAGDPGEALANLARSLCSAGEGDGALDAAERMLATGGTPVNERQACLVGVMVTIGRRDYDAARVWIERLRQRSIAGLSVRAYEAEITLRQGDAERALEMLASMPDVVEDEVGLRRTRDSWLGLEVDAALASGRVQRGVERVLEVTAREPVAIKLPVLLRLFAEAGTPIDRYLELVAADDVLPLLGQALSLRDEDADELFERAYAVWPQSRAVLAAALQVAGRRTVLRALEWSARARGLGITAGCPLLAIAEDPGRPARERVLAAAVALESFRDDRALPLFLAAADAVPDAEADTVTSELTLLAPRVVGELLV